MAKRPICPEDLLRLVLVGDPQISPAGDRVLFSKKVITEKNSYLSHLWTVDIEGRLTQWTQGEKSTGVGRWSPDGAWIGFVSGRDGPAQQIYLISTCGGEARPLLKLQEGSIGGFLWSPDSAKIAFTFRPAIPELTESAKKERDEKGLSKPPLVFNDVMYRLDGDGYFADHRYELFVVDVTKALAGKGDLEQSLLCRYSADAAGDYSYGWSPSSDELAVIHNVSRRPFVDPPNKQIWRLSLDGQAWKLEGLPKGDKGNPKWSPDGKWIAYVGDVDENDPWGTRNTKLYVVAADGGEPRDLTGHQDYDLEVATLSDTKDAGFGSVIEWCPDGTGLFAQIGWHGAQQLGFVSMTGGIELLTEGNHSISIGSVASSGRRIAGAISTAVKVPEIIVLERELATGRWAPKVLTDLNHDFHAEVELSEPEELHIPTTDGLETHAWVLKPIGYLEPKRYAAVLQVHGGPHCQYGWHFFHEMQCQAAAGYVVVYSNPRGSKGYGEAWTAAIRGNWGNKDWDDIQAVKRWMEHQPYIHPGRSATLPISSAPSPTGAFRTWSRWPAIPTSRSIATDTSRESLGVTWKISRSSGVSPRSPTSRTSALPLSSFTRQAIFAATSSRVSRCSRRSRWRESNRGWFATRTPHSTGSREAVPRTFGFTASAKFSPGSTSFSSDPPGPLDFSGERNPGCASEWGGVGADFVRLEPVADDLVSH